MEAIINLVKSGDIRDGALLCAHGRVRMQDGEVFIQSLEEQIEIDGKSVQEWRSGKDEKRQEEQREEEAPVAQLDQEITNLQSQVRELTGELFLKNRVILDIQTEVQKEKEINITLQKQLREKETLLKEVMQDLKYAKSTLQDMQDQVAKSTKQRETEKQYRQHLQEDTNKITSDWERKTRELRANLNKANYELEHSRQEQLNNQMTIYQLKKELEAKQKELELINISNAPKRSKIKKFFKKTKSVPGVI